MATIDMAVIKEIPGYKVILKSVLKSQIQQLVEQLASHTDEESVILTASVSDGTLSHLGSQSGKSFLNDHEDVKSQFLGFCLKRHHKQKQLGKDQEEITLRGDEEPSLGYINYHQAPRFTSLRMPRMSSSQHQALHLGAMSRLSPGTHSPGFRHEPYPRIRPMCMPGNVAQSVMSPGHKQMTMKLGTKDDGQVIKIEQEDDGETCNQNNAESSLTTLGEENSSHTPSQSVDNTQVNMDRSKKDSDVSDSDAAAMSTNGLEPQTDQLPVVSVAADQPGSGTEHREEAIDSDSIVKLEAISESEIDLEIMGMEPGRSVMSQENWAANVAMDMGFDSTGVTGMQLDLQGSQQGYMDALQDKLAIQMNEGRFSSQLDGERCQVRTAIDLDSVVHQEYKQFQLYGYQNTADLTSGSGSVTCTECGKEFGHLSGLRKHQKTIHGDSKVFHCKYCPHTAKRKYNLKTHMYIIHSKTE